MEPYTDRQSHTFPDGSLIEWTVTSSDAAVYNVLTTSLSRRMNRADTLFPMAESDVSLVAYAAFAPAERSDAHESTTTYRLADGELTVRIDASSDRVHGYLHYLVRESVAFARVLDVDVPRAGLLAVAAWGCGLWLGVLGQYLLAALVVAPGGVIALYVLVYHLAARGVHVSVLEPRAMPTDRYR